MKAVEDYLEQQLVEKPQYQQEIIKLNDLYQKRLWHQLTLYLQNEFLKNENIQKEFDLVKFFYSFILDFAAKINQLSFVKMTITVSQQIPDLKAKCEFIKKASEMKKVIEEKPAHIYIRSYLAEIYVQLKDLNAAKAQLDQTKVDVEELVGLESEIYAAYYHAWLVYHKANDSPKEFYRTGLLYIAYTDLKALSAQEKMSLAFDMGIASLIGDDIYNFGELVSNEIMSSLIGTPFRWLREVIYAFSHGNLSAWKKLQVQFADALNQQPALVANKQLLEQKITILSLIELVFNSPSKEISFDLIAKVSQLPKSEVEWLVMKAFALGLIRGTIDQVQEVVYIHWIQPRVLSIEQIEKMKERMKTWTEEIKNILLVLENQLASEVIS
jgi:26S proteasome regulatory subunit N9